MEKKKHWGSKIIFPPMRWVLTCALITIVLMPLANRFRTLMTFAWGFFMYSLTIFACATPKMIRGVFVFLNRHKYTSMFVNDVNVRIFVSLYFNMIITTAYACFDLFTGLVDHSEWLVAISFYYLVLTVIRFYLLSYVNRHHGRQKIAGRKFLEDLKRYKFTGIMLLVLLVPYCWIAFMMLEKNQSYSYRGLMLYVMAGFTIYQWVMVVFGHIVYRKIDAPILTSTRALNFACSIVSLLSFETAWFSGYGETRQILVALSGTAGGIAVFGVAFGMVSRAHSILSLNFVPGGKDRLKFWDALQQKKADYAQEKEKYNAYIEKHWNTDEIDNYRWIRKTDPESKNEPASR